MLPSKFRFIWLSGFREDFLEIDQPETRIAYGGHVCKRIGIKWAIFIEDLPCVGSFGSAVSEEKIKIWKVNRRWSRAKAHFAFGELIKRNFVFSF